MNVKSRKGILRVFPTMAMLCIVVMALFIVVSTPQVKATVTLPLIGVLTGQTGNRLGETVCSAGDMDGDGYDDVVVARNYTRPWVYFGSSLYKPAPAGPNYPSKDVELTQSTTGYCGGYPFFVSLGGDVNGDGYDDVITGAGNARKAYVYFGGATVNGIPDVTLPGPTGFGGSVGMAGDANGDGFADVIVGRCRCYNPDAQGVVFFGGDPMDTTADVTTYGSPGGCECYGGSVSSAGDVNNDGYDDILVTEAGTAYVYFGGDPMDNAADVTFSVPGTAGHKVPRAMSAGDVNADGYDDVIIGACYGNTAYIYFGGDPMDNTADKTLTGEASGDWFGHEVNTLGDVNGDGYDDVIVGAPRNDAGGSDAGRAYIYLGGDPMDITADAIVTGEAAGDMLGYSVSLAGDINANGYDDVIVGAPYNDAGGSNAGRAYIFGLEVFKFSKFLEPTEGGLGTVVHVKVYVPLPGEVASGQTVTVVDTLPSDFGYINGTFTVDGVPATPTITKIGPPPSPPIHKLTYTLTQPGHYLIEFDCKVDTAYWEDREVVNVATGTWYDEGDNVVEEKEVEASFIIYAFKELHKTIVPEKVKVIPAPVQFWREFIGGVTDIIVSDPPDWPPEGVALVREYAVLHAFDPMPQIPLELLTWEGTEGLPWKTIDTPEDPCILLPGESAEYDIYTDSNTTAVLVRYTVAWASTQDVIEVKFVNEAILEKSSPQVIVGQLSNFDVHNDYHEPVDNFELELYGIQPSDIVDWFPGWGAPPQINPIPGGTEIMWKDPAQPVLPCHWEHFGLHLKPGVIAEGVKAYWTQTGLTIKEKTETQWTIVMEVANPFSYTMKNVVIKDNFGAEIEIDLILVQEDATCDGKIDVLDLVTVGLAFGSAPGHLYWNHAADVDLDEFVDIVDLYRVGRVFGKSWDEIVPWYTGESDKIHLTWTIGDLAPGNVARLRMLVSTDLNPAGHQEYTEPGIYEMNSGATLNFIDPEQDMQLSACTDSIYVTVLPEDDC